MRHDVQASVALGLAALGSVLLHAQTGVGPVGLVGVLLVAGGLAAAAVAMASPARRRRLTPALAAAAVGWLFALVVVDVFVDGRVEGSVTNGYPAVPGLMVAGLAVAAAFARSTTSPVGRPRDGLSVGLGLAGLAAAWAAVQWLAWPAPNAQVGGLVAAVGFLWAAVAVQRFDISAGPAAQPLRGSN